MPQPMQPRWIADDRAAADLIADIAASDRVAFDTEFHGERSYLPHLMLLQVATERAIYLVDPLADVDMRAIFQALAASSALPIGHALHNDLEIVAVGFDIVFPRVFDTQIAAAFLGAGLQIGLGNLLSAELGVRLPKGAQMADWSRRPLPERQLAYAADDVRYLLQVHDAQSRRLRELGREDWVDQECAGLSRRDRYGRDPMQCWQRVSGGRKLRPKELGVLVELAAEREIIAAEVDQVPHFLLNDDALISLAKRAPTSADDLDGGRRTGPRSLARYAERWLAAIQRGLGAPLQLPHGRPPPAPGLEAVAALVMLLVTEISGREGIAPQLLVRRKTLLDALAEGCGDKADMCRKLELEGWRANILADPIWDLLSGKTGAWVRCDDSDPLGVDFVAPG